MTIQTVLTIGHSNHQWGAFASLLSAHGIDALLDVRSTPYSRFNPQFNRNELVAALSLQDIQYHFLGRELGGRPKDPSCYESGRVRYDRVAKTAAFHDGIERVTDLARRQRIVLMCSEKDPLDCHRTLLVARKLEHSGVSVSHVLADGTVETHAHAMDRLLEKHDMNVEGDLWTPRDELVATAVERQSDRVGFEASGTTPP